MVSEVRAVVYANGSVLWSPGFRWRTVCQVSLRTFPYDTQKCNVSFINWNYRVHQVNFKTGNSEVFTSDNLSDEWELTESLVSVWELVVSEEIQFPIIEFTLTLKRFPGYFVTNVLFPNTILTLMSALVFCLPPESGEKIGLSITVLLSYTVIILMLSDITPRSSSVPVIS